jgi:hypothetical protein
VKPAQSHAQEGGEAVRTIRNGKQRGRCRWYQIQTKPGGRWISFCFNDWCIDKITCGKT